MNTSRCRLAAASLTVSTLAVTGLASGASPADAATTAPFTITRVATDGAALAINNRGDVLAQDGDGNVPPSSSLVPHGGTRIDLIGDTSASSVSAVALNAHGVSVGEYISGGVYHVGATWSRRGVRTDVPTYPGASYDDSGELTEPFDINDSGALVGYAYLPSVTRQVATRWSAAGVPSQIDPTGTNVYVTAINNQGVVSGVVANHAALFGPKKQVTALGRLSGETYSEAIGITDSGVAFGYSERTTAGGTVVTPVAWDSTGHITRLTHPAGTTGADVTAGNVDGVLVGVAGKSNGETVAVEWKTPTATPVVLPKLAASTGAGNYYQATSINDSGVVAGSTVFDPGTGGYTVPLTWTPIKS